MQGTMLGIQACVHYLRHWRLIHLSLHWEWKLVHKKRGLSVHLHSWFDLQRYWRFRSIFIIISTGGQFISHFIGNESVFYQMCKMTFIFIHFFVRNRIGGSGMCSLSSGLEVNSTITSIRLEECFLSSGIFSCFFQNEFVLITELVDIQDQFHCHGSLRDCRTWHHWT